MGYGWPNVQDHLSLTTRLTPLTAWYPSQMVFLPALTLVVTMIIEHILKVTIDADNPHPHYNTHLWQKYWKCIYFCIDRMENYTHTLIECRGGSRGARVTRNTPNISRLPPFGAIFLSAPPLTWNPGSALEWAIYITCMISLNWQNYARITTKK